MKAKLFMLTSKAQMNLKELPECSQDQSNEKDWALFVMRSRNRVGDAKLPKCISSRESYIYASSMDKKAFGEWEIQQKKEIEPMQLKDEFISSMFPTVQRKRE